MKNKEKHTKKYFVNKTITIICSIVLAVCIIVLAYYFVTYYKNKHANDNLKKQYYSTPVLQTENPNKILARFNSFLETNPDTYGWIMVPGTNIDYPVVHIDDAETGNSFYLNHNFYKESSKAGTIFIDYRNVISKDACSDNLIIYGHNQADGSMFGQLKKYKNIDFYKENPVITFTSLYSEDKYKIIGYFVINNSETEAPVFDYHNYIQFNSEDEFNKYLTEVNARSYIHNDVDVKYGDKLITLSTCSSEFEDGRFAVIARKVRPGESADVDVSKIEKNPDIKRDPSWYKR